MIGRPSPVPTFAPPVHRTSLQDNSVMGPPTARRSAIGRFRRSGLASCAHPDALFVGRGATPIWKPAGPKAAWAAGGER